MVELESRRPLRLGVEPVLVRLLGERGEEGRVPLSEPSRRPSCSSRSTRVLADRLQHQEAVVADRLQKARVDERRRGRRDRRSQTSSAASSGKLPAKTESAAKSCSGVVVEQVVAPLDRGAQRALALGGVTRAARQQRERRVEALEEPLGSEKLRTRGGELDRERESVEPAADRLDGRVGRELPPDRTGPLDEERGRIARGERLQPVLPLARHVQRRPARDEHAETTRRPRGPR